MHNRTASTGLIDLLRPALIGAACATLAACEDAPPPAPLPGLTLVASQEAAAGTLPGADSALRRVHYRDRHGEGVLVIERSDGSADDAGDALQVAILTARLYLRPAPDTAWRQQWQRQIRQPCAGKALEAGWLLEHVGASDLDGDGQAEITLASRTFCGDAGDPHQLHVSLIDGSTSYGIEGEWRATATGAARLGPDRHSSLTLATAPAPFVQHLEGLWAALDAAAAAHTRDAH